MSKKRMNSIIVVIENGIVQEIITSSPCRLFIADYDTLEYDDDQGKIPKIVEIEPDMNKPRIEGYLNEKKRK